MVEITKDIFQFEIVKGEKIYFSYLWKRSEGNIMFNHIPNAEFWKTKLNEIGKIGGIKWVYITHAGDADEGTLLFHKTFGTELVGEEYEGEKARKKSKVPHRKTILPNSSPEKGLKCISAPGHCPSFIAFKIKGPKSTCVFTSDMFHKFDKNKWKVTIPERLALTGIKSINNIFDEEFDMLLPGLAGSGLRGPYKMNKHGRKELKDILQNALRKKYKIAA